MKFEDLVKRAGDIRGRYDDLNVKKRGRKWDAQDLMAGFVGDVGDLSKIIMAKAGLRDLEDADAKLAHELSDCLWSVLVLANAYDIDLEAEFLKTMDELEARIKRES